MNHIPETIDSETELRRMITKAIDDAWIAGREKGKTEGRRAGIEEALNECVGTPSAALVELRIKRLLEAK